MRRPARRAYRGGHGRAGADGRAAGTGGEAGGSRPFAKGLEEGLSGRGDGGGGGEGEGEEGGGLVWRCRGRCALYYLVIPVGRFAS